MYMTQENHAKAIARDKAKARRIKKVKKEIATIIFEIIGMASFLASLALVFSFIG